ncbi:vitamin K epoxide reductase family protein [Aquimarina algiphila]|uniref:vitamin K epoxide reductase family protein n=1 Tax=Aquimarina algiphila TaxID=2047982 RepID=UPI002491578A|nr:vitamin K epoxide reductase family protein [Aquimarina algiphila]
MFLENRFQYFSKYISEYNYSVDKNKLLENLLSHPNFPSIYAFSDTLDSFGINNVVAKISKSELDDLPDIFLAVVEHDNKLEIVYIRKYKNHIKLILPDNKTEKLSINNFIEIWDGIILAIEEEGIERSSVIINKINTIIANNFIVLPIIGLTLLNINFNNHYLHYYILLIFSVFGLYISTNIYKKYLGYSTSITNKFCNTSKKVNCDKILSIDSPIFFGLFTLSDVCVIYFSLQVANFSLIKYDQLILFLTVQSIVSLFFIPYSIYRQVKIGSWCTLCMLINITLLSQFVIVTNHYFYQDIIVNLEYSLLLKPFCIFVLFTCVWFIFKKLFEQVLTLKKFKTSFIKIKRDPEVFKVLVKNQPQVDILSLETIETLDIGNSNASIQLYSVLSPTCSNCKNALREHLELISKNPNSICIKIIIHQHYSYDIGNMNSQFVDLLYHLNLKKSQNTMIEALTDWYEEKNGQIENWIEKWKMDFMIDSGEITKKHHIWCSNNLIQETPCTIISGYILPKQYSIEDIGYFLQDLAQD